MYTHIRFAWLAIVVAVSAPLAAQPLWTIGTADGDDREFASAPSRYVDFARDPVFFIGHSNPRTDWPYVLPGPSDDWAGGKSHTASIEFGINSAPTQPCNLHLALVDAQNTQPPTLSIKVNGKQFLRQPERGNGDASVEGNPEAGRHQTLDIAIPRQDLLAGVNEISVTTLRGSWILWDAISLDAPGATLADIELTRITNVDSPPVLVRRAGALTQLISVTVVHAGAPVNAIIRVGRQTVNATLADGVQTVEIPVPPVSAEQHEIVRVADERGAELATLPVVISPVRKWVVYLLPHSHVDIGYTAFQADVLNKQFSNLETAIDLARKTADYPPAARFKWNAEVLWAVDAYLKQAPPDKRAALIDAVHRGWLELDGLYCNELTGLCGPEELLHLVEPSTRIAAMTGVPIRSAMISDVPGYTWGMVPALAEAGVRYFSQGPNGGDRIGPTIQAWGDKPFWWISPSGDRKVLFWMAGTGYSWFSGQTLAQKGEAPMLRYLQQLEARDYPYDMVQVRYTTNGDNGAPDPTLSDTVKEWNERHEYPKMVIATTTEMFRAFEARYGKSIPRVRGDFTPYWEDGAASTARETAMNRAAADRLTQAETLWTMRNARAFPRSAVDEAWRNVVLYDEHTWGAWNSISDPDSDFVKRQWAVKQKYAVDADRQSKTLLAGALPRSVQPQPDFVDVFNTNSWDRTDLAIVPANLSRGGDRVVGADGWPVPSQRLSSGELAFIAKNVPAFGASRFRIVAGKAIPGKALPSATGLSTGQIALSVSPADGAITELRCNGSNFAKHLNRYAYVAGRDPKAAATNGKPTIRVKERGSLVASVEITSSAPGANSLVREVRVVDGVRQVEITDTLDKQAIRTKESVHFGFEFNVPKGQIRLDTPWAMVRPEIDQIAGACKNWFTVQHWVDVSNGSAGVTLATPDAPLVEIGGITAELPAIAHVAPTQTLYSYVMNNYWHTNYKADQSGLTIFRYVLQPHGKFDAAAAARFSADVARPLIVAPAAGADPAPALLRITPTGVIATSLLADAGGKVILLRLFGASGKLSRATLKWRGTAPKAVYISDLAGRRVRRVTGAVPVPAWGLVSLRIER